MHLLQEYVDWPGRYVQVVIMVGGQWSWNEVAARLCVVVVLRWTQNNRWQILNLQCTHHPAQLLQTIARSTRDSLDEIFTHP